MPTPFDAQLVNGPFGDPALYVDLVQGGRALLLDLGDLAALRPRKLLRVSDVFVSHAHMDHWCGFDQLLRVVLGREKRLRLFGPPGMIDRVEHRLRGYTWNLLGGYANELVLEVSEVGEGGPEARAAFAIRSGFAREPLDPLPRDPLPIEGTALQVRTALLDHGIPCLAWAVLEPVHVNVWKNRLVELGLGAGPWLAELKRLALAGAPAATPVVAESAAAPPKKSWRAAGPSRPGRRSVR